MAQTVIGLFDTATEAQQAVHKLTNKGFSRENIDVSNSGYATGSDATGSTSLSHEHTDHHEGNAVTRFFKNLFSDDDDNSGKYSTVASRSGSIVTVHAQTSEQAEEAADILDDAGAVNVDERAASYGYTGSSSSGNAGYAGTQAIGSNLGDTDYAGTQGTSGSYSGADYAGTQAITGDLGTTGYTGTAGTGGYTGTTGMGNTETNAGFTASTGTPGDMSDVSSFSDTDDTRKIPVIEENLEVGKREVRTGGVRLRSRIVERPVEESLRLRQENVTVERTPVDRVATSADLANFEGTSIEMTETAEVPVVSKEARVVEEVSLGKDVDERTETISDTVRRTEVEVENLDSDDVSGKRY